MTRAKKLNIKLANFWSYPNYEGLSLVSIPHIILAHFGIETLKSRLPRKLSKDLNGVSNIILFIIDGFGMNLFKKSAKHNLLFKKMIKKKKVYRITSVFPPSTPGALTSLHTGLTPKEHGLIEWYLYFHDLDSVVKTIPYKRIDTGTGKKILPNDPKIIFNGKTIYEHLAENGIKSYCLLPRTYLTSMYTKATMRGSMKIAYGSMEELMKKLKNKIGGVENSYMCVYISLVDSVSHIYGPNSIQALEEAEKLGNTIKIDFLEKLDSSIAKKTGIILVADHGQTSIDPSKTIYLNEFPNIVKNFKNSKNGVPIPPTGNPRNVFLSIRVDKIEESIDYLKNILKNKADIIKLNKKHIEQLFGNKVAHTDFVNRIGNILILPRGDNSVWYEYGDREKINYHGHHGGLENDSMIIPLVISDAYDLTSL